MLQGSIRSAVICVILLCGCSNSNQVKEVNREILKLSQESKKSLPEMKAAETQIRKILDTSKQRSPNTEDVIRLNDKAELQKLIEALNHHPGSPIAEQKLLAYLATDIKAKEAVDNWDTQAITDVESANVITIFEAFRTLIDNVDILKLGTNERDLVVRAYANWIQKGSREITSTLIQLMIEIEIMDRFIGKGLIEISDPLFMGFQDVLLQLEDLRRQVRERNQKERSSNFVKRLYYRLNDRRNLNRAIYFEMNEARRIRSRLLAIFNRAMSRSSRPITGLRS